MNPRGRRIGLALESSGPGGAERVLLQLGQSLREAGDHPVLFSMRSGWMTENALAADLPVEIVPQRPGLDPLWVPRFAGRLRARGIEILHSHEFAMNIYGGAAARLARLPTLATIHGHAWIGERSRRIQAYRVLNRLGMRLATVSFEMRGYLARTFEVPETRVGVIHNGIPVPARFPTAAEAARRAAGLPDDGPLVLAIGNLYPVKDHATLLRAAAKLPGVRVAIAGRGEEEQTLRALATELGVLDRVHLLGVRDDVPRLLEAADVFTQPSREEGLPMAILESMAAGRAVVASGVGGIGEAVVDGQTGLLVPPADPQALASALRRVIDDPALRARLGTAGHARARDAFSAAAMTENYRTLYATLCDPPHALPATEPAP